MALVPSSLAKVLAHETKPFHSVFIQEIAGHRHFAIEIGVVETAALVRKVEGSAEPPRPMTHDLAANIISSLGGHVREVRITDLRGGTFFAQLVIDTDEGEVLVDSRPSDALVLAATEKCKLMVEDSVFAAAAKE